MRFVEARWRALLELATATATIRPEGHGWTALEHALYPWVQFYGPPWPARAARLIDEQRLGVMMHQLLVLEVAHELAMIAKGALRIESTVEGDDRRCLRTVATDWQLALSFHPQLHAMAPAGMWIHDLACAPDLVERHVTPVVRALQGDLVAQLDEALRRRYLEPATAWPA